MDDCVAEFHSLISGVRSCAAIDHWIVLQLKSKNSQMSSIIFNQRSRPFFILTQFDHGRSSEYKLCDGPTPLPKLFVTFDVN